MSLKIPKLDLTEYWDAVRNYVATFDLATMNGRFPRGITQYTHENPMTVIGTTLAVGLIMGVFSFLAAQLSVRRHRPRRAHIKKEATIEEEDEDLSEEAFNIPPPLRGGFDTKMLASLRKNKGLIRTEGDKVIETKLRCSMEENEESEPLLKKESQEKKEKKKNKGHNKKSEKKVGFDRTVINQNEVKDLGDLSELANGEALGQLGELHGKLKTAEIRAKSKIIEREMSREQLDEEARIKAEQMEAIFRLMKADEDKFGIHDRVEMEEQLRLYAL